MNNDIFISNHKLDGLSVEEKITYFSNLKMHCISSININKSRKKDKYHKIITNLYPYLINYEYEYEGIENIPKDGKALFMCNHSNAHDFFTSHIMGEYLGTNVAVFAAGDDLNTISKFIFNSCGATLIDRNDKNSTHNGMLEFGSDLINGIPGVIFGEATWNLHPIKPMQDIKIGGAMIAAITQVPIIPTIFEYVEVPNICRKEKELYSKCIVKFCKPITISRTESLINQTNNIQSTLENERLTLWKYLGVEKSSIKDINSHIYLNHTYLKKFDSLGFTYDSESEAHFLFSKDKKPVENEFRLNEKGELVPGITQKEEGKKLALYLTK